MKITDEQWEKVKAVLPVRKRPRLKKKRGGRPPVDDRKCFEGIKRCVPSKIVFFKYEGVKSKMPLLNELRKTRKDALVITAHPDDESLFIGGTIVEFRKWRWRILCVTDCDERYNKVRRNELRRACRIYRRYSPDITPFMLGVTMKSGRFSTTEIIRKIRQFLSETGVPDIVFTHNANGEYGHRTHKIVYNAVKSIKFRKLYTFLSRKQNPHQVLRKDFKREEVRLSRQSLSIKKRAILLYLKGSQRTNLSRLARVVNNALDSETESFRRYR